MPLDVSNADTLEVSFPDVNIFMSTKRQKLKANLFLKKLMVELFPSKAEAKLLEVVGETATTVIGFTAVLTLIS